VAGPQRFETDGRFAPGRAAPNRHDVSEKPRRKPRTLAEALDIANGSLPSSILDSVEPTTDEEGLEVRHNILPGGVYYVSDTGHISKRH